MTDPEKCVILVPANYGIEPECERGLVQLERRGYPVWRIRGFAAIDQCRNQVATDALARGFEELFWIDADIEFHPDSVDRLRAHNLPLLAGIYPKKSARALASRLFSTTKEVVFGAAGGLIEILYAATGFLHTRREVYEAIRRHWNLPVCNAKSGKPTVPYFMPMVVVESDEAFSRHPHPRSASSRQAGPLPEGEGEREGARVAGEGEIAQSAHSYLADDFSFSHRARGAGSKTSLTRRSVWATSAATLIAGKTLADRINASAPTSIACLIPKSRRRKRRGMVGRHVPQCGKNSR
jgi:hypothetical protein